MDRACALWLLALWLLASFVILRVFLLSLVVIFRLFSAVYKTALALPEHQLPGREFLLLLGYRSPQISVARTPARCSSSKTAPAIRWGRSRFPRPNRRALYSHRGRYRVQPFPAQPGFA